MSEDKEKKIEKLRSQISYLTEQLKVTYSAVDKAVISDKILNAKRELGLLQSAALDRVKKVDILDGPPLADRIEAEAKTSSGIKIKRNIISF